MHKHVQYVKSQGESDRYVGISFSNLVCSGQMVCWPSYAIRSSRSDSLDRSMPTLKSLCDDMVSRSLCLSLSLITIPIRDPFSSLYKTRQKTKNISFRLRLPFISPHHPSSPPQPSSSYSPPAQPSSSPKAPSPPRSSPSVVVKSSRTR